MGDSPKRILRCPDNIAVNLGVGGNRGGMGKCINTIQFNNMESTSYLLDQKDSGENLTFEFSLLQYLSFFK
jgi:hypothetical protein